MTLFPNKINGKFVAILSVNTDNPPSGTYIAYFDKEEDIWSPEYWKDWYANLDYHEIPIVNTSQDHVEIGAQPIKTKEGWLLLYSYIQNYFNNVFHDALDRRKFVLDSFDLHGRYRRALEGRQQNAPEAVSDCMAIPGVEPLNFENRL